MTNNTGLSTRAARPLRLYLLAALFACAVPLAFFVDFQVTSFLRADGLPGDIRKLITLSEAFSHGYGVAVILLGIFLIDHTSRARFPQLLCCVWIPGLLVNVIKLLVARHRPYVFDQAGFPATIWETFAGWLPGFGFDMDRLSDSTIQSFPSGHTTQAVAFAIGLSWLYPKGRWLFAALAILAAVQRLESRSHFLSDTLAGAALGCCVAAMFLDTRLLGRLFPDSATHQNPKRQRENAEQ